MNNGQCINRNCELQVSIKLSDMLGLSQIVALFSVWRQRVRTRHYLASMPRHLLNDIGIDESQRQQEIAKPFWR